MIKLLCFIFGLLIGILLHGVVYTIKLWGEIQMDTSDPDKDIYRLVWTKDPDGIKKKKYIVLEIKKGYNFKSEDDS